jgi:Tol biopolymer transport system component
LILPTAEVPGGTSLTGRLIFTTFDPTEPTAVPYIAQLDLATGALSPVWVPPANSWLGGMALSPDGQTLVLVYAPPPPGGGTPSGFPGLFLLPGRCLSEDCGGTLPQPLLAPVENESYFAPAWTPDAKMLYYAHVTTSAVSDLPEYRVERISPVGGQPQVMVPLATWPQISPDGNTLAYVAFDYSQGLNDLYFASPDGTNGSPPMPLGAFYSVDGPVFSPDGQFIYFSATGPGPNAQGSAAPHPLTWLERLTGVQIAFANGAPSEWWRLPVAGGAPTQLTNIAAVGLSGTFSPDGQKFATISYSGVGVMNADGSDFAWLYPGTAIGAVIWLP